MFHCCLEQHVLMEEDRDERTKQDNEKKKGAKGKDVRE